MSEHFEQTSSAPIPEIPDTENIVDRLEHQENNRYGAVFPNLSSEQQQYVLEVLEKIDEIQNQISTIEDSVTKYQLREQCYRYRWNLIQYLASASAQYEREQNPLTRILEKWRGLWKNILPNEVALSQ